MSEEQDVPKKITLTVPSLFIKSTSSSGQSGTENGDQPKRPARPMPASMKKKLEEAKQNELSSKSSDVSASGSEGSSERKVSRPMPASARRKLEETAKVQENIKEEGDSESTSCISETTPLSRPMPASARAKLEGVTCREKKTDEDTAESEVKTEDAQHKNVNKPMPAFAKRKMGELAKPASLNEEGYETVSNCNEDKPEKKGTRAVPASVRKLLEEKAGSKANNEASPDSENSEKNESLSTPKDETKKVGKPMPASARRKLEETSNNTTLQQEKDDSTINQGHKKNEDETEELCNQIVEQSEDEKTKEETKEAKKINISLGGIKFPTFKKPMPASAKRKAEEAKLGTADDTGRIGDCSLEASVTERKSEESEDRVEQTINTGRRGRSSAHEFVALEDKKYPCDVCGIEFYSQKDRNNHQRGHFERKNEEKPTPKRSEKSNSKSKKKVSMYKGMKACPHCNKPFSNWKKIGNHASKCKPGKFSCSQCGKTFHNAKNLESHTKAHQNVVKVESSQEDPFPIPISNHELSDEPAHSPVSVDSRSSKHSVVEKPKPMPRSVKAKLEKDTEGTEMATESKQTGGLSKGVQSFKRKIADVLSTLGNRKFNSPSSPELESKDTTEEVEDEGPPRKKTIASSKSQGEGESIRGHPMPASVKKKLQNRVTHDQERLHSVKAKETSAPSTPKPNVEDQDDLDDLECEVCHKVFSRIDGRQKHEKTIHSIVNPRLSKAKAVKKEPKPEPKSELDLNSIPNKGKCPICLKFIKYRLKRHVRNVHKMPAPSSSGSLGARHKLSYKIYKSAASKAKQKLAVSNFKRPIISVEKLVPLKTEDVKVPIKSESKVIASTASSELRCACCDKIFEVQCDFYEHMAMEHSNLKRLVTCKLCDHRFSHEEDFLLHIQFKHRDIVSSMKQKNGSTATKKSTVSTPGPAKKKNITVSASRSLRKSVPENTSQTQSAGNSNVTVPLTIKISAQDIKRAETARKKESPKTSGTPATPSTSSRSTRRSSAAKAETPEPEPMQDSYLDDSDHHFDDSEAMEVEESEIAITSTFSQKVASPQKKGNNKTETNELDAMHCSTCSEVFYSYEALRKHELYFHNVKTTKMCPICGVYPTRLSRHLLAHENKTVRCSCVPCRLSFPEFSQLLKHNLEKHPGANGGALCAPNKPRDQIQKNGEKVEQTNSGSDPYRCLLCKKEFPGAANARRHIRRNHPEQEADTDTLIQKVGEVEMDKEVEDILEDTNKKLQDPDWNTDDDDDKTEVSKTQSTSTSVKKPSRPMPASVRAKLQIQQDTKLSHAKDQQEANSVSTLPVSKRSNRPLPASVRAKLEAEKKEQEAIGSGKTSETKSVNQIKPSRPMPASVRAKLLAQSDSENSRDSFSSSSTNKVRRPMPASVKAKLGFDSLANSIVKTGTSLSVLTVDSDEGPPSLAPEVILEPEVKKGNADPDVIEIDDDDDPMDADDSIPEPMPPSVPTFSIADEIAEHNRAVQIAMGGSQSRESNFDFASMFQCKLCNKKFETMEDTRRHIRKAHSEYGPDLAENLIGQLHEEYVDTPRRRRATLRYTEDDEDEEEEVIITRGTTSRTKQKALDASSWSSVQADNVVPKSKPKTPTNNDLGMYACRFCGQRKDSIANIRRHIMKAHPQLSDQREQGVVVVGSGQEHADLPPPPPAPAPKPAVKKAGNPIYVCKICSKCMTVRSSLYMHIIRIHTEVEQGTATQFIQELNGSGDNSSYDDAAGETPNVNSDTSFYCSICSYQTNDEREYVRHYKGHTGVSPYQCQYCAATFNRQQELNAHVTREHTGAEFLTNDEAEISMEEVVTSNEVSVAPTSKIHIETPNVSRRQSSDSNGHSEVPAKKYTPGPASRKTAAARKSMPMPVVDTEEPMETENSPSNSPAASVEDNAEVNDESQKPRDSSTFSYQGDLSSLFPTLGGGTAPGGIDALDDIDGGMSLD